jgi:hypothetical protein
VAKAYSVNVRVGATITDFDKKMKKVTKGIQQTSQKFQKVGSSLTSGISLPILGATAAIGGMVTKSAKSADELLRLADVTGMSTTEIQKMSYAAQQLGTDFETIEGAQTKLTRQIAEADSGNTDAIKNFEALGIAIYDNNGELKDAPTLFNETLDALGKIEDPIKRDALAMDMMGKSARDLNPLIKAGSDEINRLKQEAVDVGAVMSEETVAKLGEFNDKVDAMKMRISASAGEMSANFLPLIEKLATFLDEKLLPALEWLVKKFTDLDPNIQIIIIAIGILLAILPPLIMFLGLMALSITAISWPVLAVVAGIVLLIFWIGMLWMNWDKVQKFFTDTWENLKTKLSAFGDFFAKVWDGVKDGFKYVMDWIIDKFEGYVNLWIKGLNLLIKGANLIPGVDIKTISEVDFNGNLQGAVGSSSSQQAPVNVYVGGQKLTSYTDYSMGNRAFA